MALAVDYVTRLFENLSNGKTNAFFDRVVDDVHWTVMGTHPLAGMYNSKADFLKHTFEIKDITDDYYLHMSVHRHTQFLDNKANNTKRRHHHAAE